MRHVGGGDGRPGVFRCLLLTVLCHFRVSMDLLDQEQHDSCRMASDSWKERTDASRIDGWDNSRSVGGSNVKKQ